MKAVIINVANQYFVPLNRITMIPFTELNMSTTFSFNLHCSERPTACVTGEWREPTHETEPNLSLEPSLKRERTTRPVHAVLGAV